MSTPFIILAVIILVFFSAVCSGLNIAIMALDPADLRRKAKLGNKAAAHALPFRRQTHRTLASILLINVAAVSATSLVLDQRFNGWISGIASTILIVILGEIVPQAIFAKNPLLWVSKLSPLLRLMAVATYPASRPLQVLLDKLVGRSQTTLQTRHELGMMITEHLDSNRSELDDDEVEIIRGALQLSEKRIRDIMTPIERVYWLTPDTKLNDQRIDELKAAGFSRIPVFNRALTNCFGIILMKELVDIDFDELTYRVDDMVLHPVQLVGSMTALDTMLRKFIASGTHLFPVERDDAIVGIVTIEDLIEEIVGREIEDETDRTNPGKAQITRR